ncbi:MAG: hydrogenase 4 membrane component (E)-like protein [Bacteroidetes bacterium]|nr:hydrogenase 4 membrane component (E)-like protein [Bacteroidota bacterium]
MHSLDSIYLLLGFVEIALVIFIQWQLYTINIIRTFSIGSFLMAAFFLVAGLVSKEVYILTLAFLTAVARGWFIPRFLVKTLKRETWREREVKPVLGVASSIIGSLLFAILGYLIYSLALQPYMSTNLAAVPIALMLQGAFLIISRSNTIAQLIGYLVMENAMYMFGYIFPELPFIVEAGIVLDVLGIVMISGIIIRLREDSLQNGDSEFNELRG